MRSQQQPPSNGFCQLNPPSLYEHCCSLLVGRDFVTRRRLMGCSLCPEATYAIPPTGFISTAWRSLCNTLSQIDLTGSWTRLPLGSSLFQTQNIQPTQL